MTVATLAAGWQHHSAFGGCVGKGKLSVPPSRYQVPLGVEVAILWGLPVCHGLRWWAMGREVDFLSLSRAQCIGPAAGKR